MRLAASLRRAWFSGPAAAIVLALPWSASATLADDGARPLHEAIDHVIDAGLSGEAAPPATDGEFLRRVMLDLTGAIPTSAEARAFLDDPSPYKRTRLIDRLLESPEFARRMSTVFDIMIMERRPDQHVPTAAWRDYLYTAFRANRPYDEVVREILAADGGSAGPRAAAKFYLDRAGEANVLTRDIGRVFLGIDMQCAQCHDHPLIDDYKQAHYYGLFAFVSRGQLAQDNQGTTTYGEKADGDVSFTSVFVKKVTHSTAPRLLDGAETPDPPVEKGQEYWSFPGDKSRVIPRYSRRSLLPARLTDRSLTAFHRNTANRLWALMIGDGLVQPLDMHHSDNPPSNPELLDLLAREFAASGCDVRRFVREIALTRAYQRSSEPPPAASTSESSHLETAVVRALTPEQLGWSVMQATGVLANYRSAAESTLVGVDPKMAAILSLDESRARLHKELIERRVYEQLNPSVAVFVQQFGGVAGQSQDKSQTTVHQALMLTNGEPIQSWLNPSGGNLLARLQKLTDSALVAEELYLSVLTRRPTADERAEVAAYLEPRAQDRDAALRELAWALLTSLEFRFNH